MCMCEHVCVCVCFMCVCVCGVSVCKWWDNGLRSIVVLYAVLISETLTE